MSNITNIPVDDFQQDQICQWYCCDCGKSYGMVIYRDLEPERKLPQDNRTLPKQEEEEEIKPVKDNSFDYDYDLVSTVKYYSSIIYKSKDHQQCLTPPVHSESMKEFDFSSDILRSRSITLPIESAQVPISPIKAVAPLIPSSPLTNFRTKTCESSGSESSESGEATENPRAQNFHTQDNQRKPQLRRIISENKEDQDKKAETHEDPQQLDLQQLSPLETPDEEEDAVSVDQHDSFHIRRGDGQESQFLGNYNHYNTNRSMAINSYAQRAIDPANATAPATATATSPATSSLFPSVACTSARVSEASAIHDPLKDQYLIDTPKRYNCSRCSHMMCPYCPKLRFRDLYK